MSSNKFDPARVPNGIEANIWHLWSETQIDEIVELEVEIAKEQDRPVDGNSLIRLALGEGFQTAMDLLRDFLGHPGENVPDEMFPVAIARREAASREFEQALAGMFAGYPGSDKV